MNSAWEVLTSARLRRPRLPALPSRWAQLCPHRPPPASHPPLPLPLRFPLTPATSMICLATSWCAASACWMKLTSTDARACLPFLRACVSANSSGSTVMPAFLEHDKLSFRVNSIAAVCRRRWGNLDSAPLFSSKYAALCARGSWRELHKERAKTLRWREVCFRLDRSLSILESASGDKWTNSFATALASLAGVVPPANECSEEVRAWVSRIIALLVQPRAGSHLLDEVYLWARTLETQLDMWFDMAVSYNPIDGAEVVVETNKQARSRVCLRCAPIAFPKLLHHHRCPSCC